MNRRDFLKQLGLIVTLPIIGLPQVATHTVGGWFKPQGGEWEFAAARVTDGAAINFPARVTCLDGRVAMIFVSSEVLPAEQIEALYQQTRPWFGV